MVHASCPRVLHIDGKPLADVLMYKRPCMYLGMAITPQAAEAGSESGARTEDH